MAETRSSWLSIALTGVALAGVGYAWGVRSTPAASPASGVPSDEDRPVVVSRRSLSSARAGIKPVAVQTRQAGTPEAKPAIGAEVAPDGAEPDDELVDPAEAQKPLDPEEAEAESQAARLKYFDELSQRIDSEVVDGAWRHATEAPLERLIAEHLGAKVSVSEVTCASTYCRVRLTHPQWPHIPADAMFEFDLARAPLEVTEAQFDNRDEGATTLYFKRGPAPASQVALADAE